MEIWASLPPPPCKRHLCFYLVVKLLEHQKALLTFGRSSLTRSLSPEVKINIMQSEVTWGEASQLLPRLCAISQT